MEASKKLKKQYGDYGDIKVRGNGMAEFILKKIHSNKIINTNTKTKKRKTNIRYSKTRRHN
jgi:hypothetical protein